VAVVYTEFPYVLCRDDGSGLCRCLGMMAFIQYLDKLTRQPMDSTTPYVARAVGQGREQGILDTRLKRQSPTAVIVGRMLYVD
jgi:hypothetical protein